MRTIARISWDEFLDRYFDPQPGQHVCMVGPNGCGKTTLGMRMVAKATELHPRTRGVVLVMKPHKGAKYKGRKASGDETVTKLTAQLGGRIVRQWPPPPRLPWQPKPSFYVFWPEHSMDPDADDEMLEREMRGALVHSYQHGGVWVFCDETAGLTDDLGLETPVRAILQRGRSMEAAGIMATQRPRNVPRAMFTEPTHFFFWAMADDAEYERLREIGASRVGLDRREVAEILSGLSEHECLYLHPKQRVVAILG